ncbi:CDP-alcohol phosphatidyltransferase [Clostridium beijerinckii]|nr:CDP-alcohol phosphatidyltransferase [Clostridium beijerinckii]
MKLIANYISISRIFLGLILALLKPLSIEFLVIYSFCGISDILDGFIARKTYTTSKLGEKLDSVADLIMCIVLIIVLYPIINLTVEIIIWIVIIGIIRVMSMTVVFIKYKTFGMLHTYGNKITGVMLFIFPLSLKYLQSDIMVYIVCVLAGISAIEEFLINLSSNKFQANRKSIFLK